MTPRLAKMMTGLYDTAESSLIIWGKNTGGTAYNGYGGLTEIFTYYPTVELCVNYRVCCDAKASVFPTGKNARNSGPVFGRYDGFPRKPIKQRIRFVAVNSAVVTG